MFYASSFAYCGLTMYGDMSNRTWRQSLCLW